MSPQSVLEGCQEQNFGKNKITLKYSKNVPMKKGIDTTDSLNPKELTMSRMVISYLSLLILILPVTVCAFDVTWGASWDNVPLQTILDDEFGVGVVDAATDYEGYLPGDADPAYWEDSSIKGLVIREIAGNRNRNNMGWYAEDLMGAPVMSGFNDNIVIEGALSVGESATVDLPDGVTRFGFYMNPNGAYDGGVNAPEPELFFTNRFYNDLGPHGAGAAHAPLDGDPQCLIYNVTHLHYGVPTFVLAWEDLDYGGVVGSQTDNDFNDMVVIIQAKSPVRNENMSWSSIKTLYH